MKRGDFQTLLLEKNVNFANGLCSCSLSLVVSIVRLRFFCFVRVCTPASSPTPSLFHNFFVSHPHPLPFFRNPFFAPLPLCVHDPQLPVKFQLPFFSPPQFSSGKKNLRSLAQIDQVFNFPQCSRAEMPRFSLFKIEFKCPIHDFPLPGPSVGTTFFPDAHHACAKPQQRSMCGVQQACSTLQARTCTPRDSCIPSLSARKQRTCVRAARCAMRAGPRRADTAQHPRANSLEQGFHQLSHQLQLQIYRCENII